MSDKVDCYASVGIAGGRLGFPNDASAWVRFVLDWVAGSGAAIMSIMVTEVDEALISAGVPDDKAKAAAGAIPVAKDLATRQDIADVKAELKQDIGDVKQDIAVLKFAVFAFGPVIVGLLVKLVFFP